MADLRLAFSSSCGRAAQGLANNDENFHMFCSIFFLAIISQGTFFFFMKFSSNNFYIPIMEIFLKQFQNTEVHSIISSVYSVDQTADV